MKQKLKIQCCDLPIGKAYDNYIFNLLDSLYELEISDEPEIVLYGPYGLNFLKFTCLRIYYTGENTRPNFKLCDYAFSFDYSNNPRNYRFPDYAAYSDINQLLLEKNPDEIPRLKTRFCNFVYSNPVPQARIQLYKLLSQYKKVDSYGRVLNNMQAVYTPEESRGKDWQTTKLEQIAKHKFTIAFESASYPGYVTEKLLHAMLCNSIPIYWGNPLIHLDFNTRALINCHEYRNFEEVVKRVIKIDNNEELYRSILAEPWYTNNRIPENVMSENVGQRLRFIVDNLSQIKPVALEKHKLSSREVQPSICISLTKTRRLFNQIRYQYYSNKYISI
jgi:hypothetical protein